MQPGPCDLPQHAIYRDVLYSAGGQIDGMKYYIENIHAAFCKNLTTQVMLGSFSYLKMCNVLLY